MPCLRRWLGTPACVMVGQARKREVWAWVAARAHAAREEVAAVGPGRFGTRKRAISELP